MASDLTSNHAPGRDPEGLRLPIKLDSASNGEFVPQALQKHHHVANRLAHELATRHAKRTGVGRRQFLVSAAGSATTLLAFNTAYAKVGKTGATTTLRQMQRLMLRKQKPPLRSPALSWTYKVIL